MASSSEDEEELKLAQLHVCEIPKFYVDFPVKDSAIEDLYKLTHSYERFACLDISRAIYLLPGFQKYLRVYIEYDDVTVCDVLDRLKTAGMLPFVGTSIVRVSCICGFEESTTMYRTDCERL